SHSYGYDLITLLRLRPDHTVKRIQNISTNMDHIRLSVSNNRLITLAMSDSQRVLLLSLIIDMSNC
ncbi:hypothetical protein LOTGIDRAFT_119144, partial [Lottia gigantea]